MIYIIKVCFLSMLFLFAITKGVVFSKFMFCYQFRSDLIDFIIFSLRAIILWKDKWLYNKELLISRILYLLSLSCNLLVFRFVLKRGQCGICTIWQAVHNAVVRFESLKIMFLKIESLMCVLTGLIF